MALSLSYGLSYLDFLSMSLNEVIAYTEKVQQIKELQNYDLAVKIGKLFSEEGLNPPDFTQKYKEKQEKVKDASELSEEERQYWVNKIVGFQMNNINSIEKWGDSNG